jgi:hypothetical protein
MTFGSIGETIKKFAGSAVGVADAVGVAVGVGVGVGVGVAVAVAVAVGVGVVLSTVPLFQRSFLLDITQKCLTPTMVFVEPTLVQEVPAMVAA